LVKVRTDERIAWLRAEITKIEQDREEALSTGTITAAMAAHRSLLAARRELDFALDSRRQTVEEFVGKTNDELTEMFLNDLTDLPVVVLEQVLEICIRKLGIQLSAAEVERIGKQLSQLTITQTE